MGLPLLKFHCNVITLLKQESTIAEGLIRAELQKSAIGSMVTCGGPLTIIVSEKAVESHLLITVRLMTYFPGLLIVKEGLTELVSVPFAKFQFDKYPQLLSTCCKSQIYFAGTQSVSELDVFN